MAKSQQLERTWMGKDVHPRLEPCILLEDSTLSYCAPTKKKWDIFDNLLIFGDNLLALKSHEQYYSGKVKGVYIDPPYNTGSAVVKKIPRFVLEKCEWDHDNYSLKVEKLPKLPKNRVKCCCSTGWKREEPTNEI